MTWQRTVLPAGGHGTCWDFPNSELLQRVLAGAAASGKVIGAVCHGPVGLVNVSDAEGRSIVAGKKVGGHLWALM